MSAFAASEILFSLMGQGQLILALHLLLIHVIDYPNHRLLSVAQRSTTRLMVMVNEKKRMRVMAGNE